MLPKGNVQRKKPPRREQANVLHLDPCDVVMPLDKKSERAQAMPAEST
jgi:hypothetical protein